MKNSINNEELNHISGGCEEKEIRKVSPAYCPACGQPQMFRFWGVDYATCTVCDSLYPDKVVLKLYEAYLKGTLKQK